MNGVDISNEMEGMVNRYLEELAHALRRLPAVRRDQLVGDIREHIVQLRAERPPVDRADMEALLTRVGLPEDIAEVALEDMEPDEPVEPVTAPVPASAMAHRRRYSNRALLLTASVVVVIGLLSVIALRGGSQGASNFVQKALVVPGPAGTNLSPEFRPRAVVTVPDVVGMSEAEAQSALAAAGLTGSFTSVASSVLVGHVVSEAPAGGSYFLVGQTVKVVVSSGLPA